MSEKSGGSIPWAGIAVVGALVSTSFLTQRAFDPLRPPEKERVQATAASDPELEVDARLWEDPFVAARRHEEERAERCRRMKDSFGRLPSECSLPELLTRRRHPDSLAERLRPDGEAPDRSTLVIAVLVPGNPFVGAEEARRRTRYAMLAGLQAQGYVPDQPERIGLLQMSLDGPEPLRDAAGRAGITAVVPPAEPDDAASQLVVPYELLSPRPWLRGDDAKQQGERHRQIALLWINESALPAPRLDSLARVLARVLPRLHGAPGKDDPRRLAVVGPSSSDALRAALKELDTAAECASRMRRAGSGPPPVPAGAAGGHLIRLSSAAGPAVAGAVATCATGSRRPAPDDDTLYGYSLLAKSHILNASATAPNVHLQELRTQRLETFLNDRFRLLLDLPPSSEVRYQRLIATDSEVIKRLVAELRLRLPAGSHRRVVVLAERDSIYSQALVAELKHRMPESCDLSFEVVYFFRGLDGVTTREGVDKARSDRPAGEGGRSATGSAAAQAHGEWPESRDQLDYLRRVATSLRESEGRREHFDAQRQDEPDCTRPDATREENRRQPVGPIGAIGILASDVHDKLLVMQALHEKFADKVFFTTDMDARFLHPRAQPFTRNLIVASSLPLEFDAPLRSGAPPLRDSYQAATYLAARLAACPPSSCSAEEKDVRRVVANPSVYEIGRRRAVALSGYDFDTRRPADATPRAIVAVLLSVLLAGMTFIHPSTPALDHVRARFFGLPDGKAPVEAGRSDLAFIVALHVLLLVYAVGSLVEFARPGDTSVYGLLLIACAAAGSTVLLLYPSATRAAAARGGAGARDAGEPTVEHRRATTDAIAGTCAFLLVVGYVIWATWPGRAWRPCTDCEPVAWLEGVSAWISHLIHLAALVVIVWSLDHLRALVVSSTPRDTAWLGMTGRPAVWSYGKGPYDACRHWLMHDTLALWRHDGGDHVLFGNLWTCLARRSRAAARAARTGFWYVVTLALAVLLFLGFSEGYVTEIPVRGAEHRRLVTWTLYAVLALLPLLVTAVADAAMLECRFIGMLNRARTSYPADVVGRFARSFGSELAPLYARRFVADPGSRDARPHDAAAVHTLLDDWLDVQLVARRTRLVGRTVIGPFLVLALVVVARSRLFDNWALTVPVVSIAALYLLWLIALASSLKVMAERLRRRALARMRADLTWVEGSATTPAAQQLAASMRQLIDSVESERTGAFAPVLEQPLFKAILVPLGGAGGAQAFDYFLLGR